MPGFFAYHARAEPFSITLHVPSEAVSSIQKELYATCLRIQEESQNIGPTDVIKVQGDPRNELDRLASGSEQAFCTLTSPVSNGSLGTHVVVSELVGQENGVCAMAMTCCHVVSETSKETRITVEHPPIYEYKDPSIDIAFIRLPEMLDNYNSVAFYDLRSLFGDDRKLIGRYVFKIGAATGFTRGKIVEVNSGHLVSNAKQYHNAVRVAWVQGAQFAASGDCGSLYFVDFFGFHVPIAIHMYSGEGFSIGLDLCEALTSLGRRAEVGYVNPPLSSTLDDVCKQVMRCAW